MTNVVIKHSYLKTTQANRGRLRAHLRYIAHRPGADKERTYFAPGGEVSIDQIGEVLKAQPDYGVLAHKLIISPAHCETDVLVFTDELLQKYARAKGWQLQWYAKRHEHTDHQHA